MVWLSSSSIAIHAGYSDRLELLTVLYVTIVLQGSIITAKGYN